jgi:hypothetical protein
VCLCGGGLGGGLWFMLGGAVHLPKLFRCLGLLTAAGESGECQEEMGPGCGETSSDNAEALLR